MATEKTVSTVKPKRPQVASRPGGDGFMQKASKYLGEVREQLRKCTWPTRQELRSQTQVVLGVLVVVGVFIFIWDQVLGQIFKGILSLIGVPHK
jgi:preprotein translocase subunit SecE